MAVLKTQTKTAIQNHKEQHIMKNEKIATYVAGYDFAVLLIGKDYDVKCYNDSLLDPHTFEVLFTRFDITHVMVYGMDGVEGDNQGGLQTAVKFVEWCRSIE